MFWIIIISIILLFIVALCWCCCVVAGRADRCQTWECPQCHGEANVRYKGGKILYLICPICGHTESFSEEEAKDE